MQAKNIKEFKELIIRYESITLKEILAYKSFPPYNTILRTSAINRLTGFGLCATCTLCIPVKRDCMQCAWTTTLSHGCVEHKTYEAIEEANTPRKLLYAVNQRAQFTFRGEYTGRGFEPLLPNKGHKDKPYKYYIRQPAQTQKPMEV